MHAVWSSLALRQALLTAALVLLALLGFATASIQAIGETARATLLRTVDTDIAGLADITAGGGLPELERRIADRLALTPSDEPAPLYFLGDDVGHRIAGNLHAMPTVDARVSEARETNGMIVRATRLRGGATLAVGRSLQPISALKARLWAIFGWAALATLVVSLGVALLVASRLGRRLARLNAAFDRFDQGDLAFRAGPAEGRDEVARLTGHVDAHLDRIEKLLRAQREISDDIAHELRTPLVHLDSRLLKALDRNADREVGEELERARADIRSVVSLFDALLDIALAESAGGSGTLRQEIDLSEVAGAVADLYQASAEEAGIIFTTRIAPSVRLRGEAMQLARLVANLLDNAFKYAPRGSRVRLSIAEGPRIVVEDDGPGVPPEEADRIFQRFLRGAAKGNGHGLGLALVTVIAARHGLSARVESASPGARFVVEPVGSA